MNRPIIPTAPLGPAAMVALAAMLAFGCSDGGGPVGGGLAGLAFRGDDAVALDGNAPGVDVADAGGQDACGGGGCSDVCIDGVGNACGCTLGFVRPCYDGEANTRGVGACKDGLQQCDGAGTWGPCVSQALPEAEVCEGKIDEDCDGQTDEQCACLSGASQPCYDLAAGTAGVGACASGKRSCAAGAWSACVGALGPGVESCDGVDNDCDGKTDEDLGGQSCGFGACAVSVPACADGKAVACLPGPAGPEICNAVDDDCDGATDEDLGLQSCGSGSCANTVAKCQKGQLTPCAPKAGAPELCDGLDNNCDGTTDEQATCPAGGELCVAGKCTPHCAAAGAQPCPAGTVCSVGDKAAGACVKPADGCVVTAAPVPCGAFSCGPGTRCDAGACLADLPCLSAQCTGGACWGKSCACKRPAPWCQTAPLAKLNLSAFTSGLVDLDFDLQCAGWGVTVLNGPDKLRKMTPAGKLEVFTGVSNLDMGEVAALQGFASSFGGTAVEVALTYTCCAVCGCALDPPQGVAWLDQVKGSLPMMIPSIKTTKGLGPFGSIYLDSGPQGLTWGLGEQLYVGNVDSNGDFHALDLLTKKKTKLATLPSRVYAAAPFDGAHLLVALENKQLLLLNVGSGKSSVLATTSKAITSVARDPFTGHIYVSFTGGEIRELSGAGKDLGVFATAAGSGRLSLAGDNHLYHLKAGPVGLGKVERYPLPAEL